MKINLLFGLLFIFVASCAEEISTSELLGKYVFCRQDECQILIILADEKYINTFQIGGKVVWRDQERWQIEIDSQKVFSGVTFEKFRFGITNYSSTPGFWFAVPERGLFHRHMKLCFDSDLNYCFAKE